MLFLFCIWFSNSANKYRQLNLLSQNIVEKYSKFVCNILDNTESVKEAHKILTQKTMNKLEVVDLIAYGNMQIILGNSRLERVVSDFWSGPYESESFLNYSSTFWEFKSIIGKRPKFLGYYKDTKYTFGLEYLLKKNHHEKKSVSTKQPKSHFFNFK